VQGRFLRHVPYLERVGGALDKGAKGSHGTPRGTPRVVSPDQHVAVRQDLNVVVRHVQDAGVRELPEQRPVPVVLLDVAAPA
jgi:hypothetical protein